jgi:hypothetical protein
MTPAEIAQQEFLDALIEDGTNRGFAPGVQTRPGGPGAGAQE